MAINKDSLKAKANFLSKKYDISQNLVYDRFFFDAFLARLAVSPYRDCFILKGGLYLANVFGADTRSTMDIDFCLKNLALEEANMFEKIDAICCIDLGDDVRFKVLNSTHIRAKDLYGGFRIKVVGKLENIRCTFGVDIATGDPIVPSEQSFFYKCLVTEEALPLKTYSLESIVAEKLETILARGLLNSRSKDFYDLYLLRKTQIERIDINVLQKAFRETCEYRSFDIDVERARFVLKTIEESGNISRLWILYSQRNSHAKDLGFHCVCEAILEWIDDVF